MKKVQVGNIVLGEGIPKICVPIVGKTREEIGKSAENLKTAVYDLVEWRMDWLEEVEDLDLVCDVAKEIKDKIHGPLLATFRSKKEGGERELSFAQYAALNLAVAKAGAADLVDVELFSGEEEREQLVKDLHQAGVKVVLSSHDFAKTPDNEDMYERLVKMEQTGADIAKLAVMPKDKSDVLRLLDVTGKADQALSCPVITMSMGKEGVISRLAGEIFGSCLTFGTVGAASAPGQVASGELKEILEKLHAVQSL